MPIFGAQSRENQAKFYMLKNLTNRLKCTEPTNVLISKNVGKASVNLSKRRKVPKASKSKRVFA